MTMRAIVQNVFTEPDAGLRLCTERERLLDLLTSATRQYARLARILVKPDTVVSWHRGGSRLFWTGRSRGQRVGRPKVAEEVRDLIRRMKQTDPMWGAPRIHGELLLLGFEIS